MKVLSLACVIWNDLNVKIVGEKGASKQNTV